MPNQLIYTDGAKSANIQDSWDFVNASKAGAIGDGDLYAKVSAVFQGVNKSANSVAYMPFALVDIKTGDDYDVSGAWENKVGFMPNPKDMMRRIAQSLIMTNMGYLRMGKNQLKMPKKLNYVIPTSIDIITDPVTGDLVRLDRSVNGIVTQSFQPDDNSLIRFWWLDEKTELLPSPDTEFKAIMNAAGILYYSDFFTKTFYERGGVKPTLIAMKGMVSNEKKDDLQKDWTSFVKGIGKYARSISAKLFNADAMDIKSFGDGLGDLKDTPVYRQALESIAIGLGMPLSMLLSNSANRATADTEYIQYYRDKVTPRCDFLADTLNEQLFNAMGLRMEYRPEQTDPENADEVANASAYSTYVNAGMKPSLAAQIVGIELPAGFEYEDLDPDEKPQPEPMPQTAPVAEQTPPAPPVVEPPAPVKWTPNLDELNELRIWREVTQRQHKKGNSLNFDYQPHYGGLPANVTDSIKARLCFATSADEIKTIFDITYLQPAEAEPKANNDEIKMLADAINKLADKPKEVKQDMSTIIIDTQGNAVKAQSNDNALILEAIKALVTQGAIKQDIVQTAGARGSHANNR